MIVLYIYIQHLNVLYIPLKYNDWVSLCFSRKLVQPALAWTTFRVGLYCGFFVILAVAFILTGRSLKQMNLCIIHILFSPAQFIICQWKICFFR